MTIALSQPQAAQALSRYQGIDAASLGGSTPGSGSDGAGFSAALGRALDQAVSAGRQADSQAMAAIAGVGDITGVVTAVSRAELAMQTTVAVRDRVLQAYQDIIKMPI